MKIRMIPGIVFLGVYLAACSTFEGSYAETSAGYVLNVLFKKDSRNVIEGTLIETSKGYHADDPETYALKDKKPDWMHQPPVDDNKVYFVGISMPQLSNLEKANKTGWSVGEAGDEAWFNVQKQVSNYIENKISTDYQEKITNVRKSTTAKDKERQTKIQEYQEEQNMEAAALESWSRSSSSFQGLQKVEVYYERYESRTREQNRIEYIHYWVLSSIPKEKIEEAREEIRKREGMEEKEKLYFESLQEQYEIIRRMLETINFTTHENEYMQRYTDLIDINARLQGLATFNNPTSALDSAIRELYNEVLRQIGKDIIIYDPTDKQKQGYESKIRVLTNDIEQLRKVLEEQSKEIYELKSNSGGVITKLEKELEVKNAIIQYLEQQKTVDLSLLKQIEMLLMSVNPASSANNYKTLPEKESLQP